MAITSNERLCDRITPASMSCSKSPIVSSCRILKTADSGSRNSKQNESKKQSSMSPYLREGRIQLLSRTTEKRLVRKTTTDFVSSFPLAVNIYKANSDEFKSLKKSKKVKKSVLTLPNEPAPVPQVCTVSDMNDSEYFNEIKGERHLKVKKRRANRKLRIKSKGIEIFDRDARYCSQLNINLDSSSTDMISQFTGDGKKCSRKRQKSQKKSALNAHDVWTMLRNMNRFPFTPSPPASQNSVESVQKSVYQNKLRNKDKKYLETCRTELTYFSSLVDKTPHNSQSSIDRITVIDKQDDYQEIREELKFLDNKTPSKDKNLKSKIKTPTKNRFRAGAIQKNVRDVGDNNKICHKFKNHKPINNLHEEVKVKSQDNKKMLTEVASNNLNISCQHNVDYINSSITKNDDLNNFDDILYWNSDSSNAEINNISNYEDHNKFDKVSPSESQLQVNGITKVVLSKGQNILLTKKAESLKRKPRLATTIPSAAVIPKLTQTEIKRRLAKIRFPLIILTKEQVSSGFQVTDYQSPQFLGLDEHIWPFMRNWCKSDYSKRITNNTDENYRVNEKTVQSKNGDCDVGHNKVIQKNVINDNNNNLSVKNKRKKCLESSDKSIVQKNTMVENIHNRVPKSKPLRQFKDRMLQFLYKKPTVNVNSNKKCFSNDVTKQSQISGSLVDVGTSIDLGLPAEQYELFKKRKMLKYESNIKHQWAKGKWASDFIENVIKKIKNGVYYNQDEKLFTKDINLQKDNSVQTEMDFSRNACYQICKRRDNPILAIEVTRDPLKSIPGFDESLSGLQIETINQKQITIKHCVTNFVVQFDVALTSEISHVVHLKQSISCIPVEVTKSQTKIFKSETTILNAKLPADLCSILPEIMRKIINSRVVLPKIDKVESHLSTIAELTRYESGESIKRFYPFHFNTSPDFQNLWQGTFADISVINSENAGHINCLNSTKVFYSPLIDDIMLNINIGLILCCQIKPTTLRICEPQHTMLTQQDYCQKSIINKSNMQLQLYPLCNRQVVPAYRKFDFNDLMIDILSKCSFKLNIIMPLLNDHNAVYYNNDITLSLAISNNHDRVTHTNSSLKVDSLYNVFQDHEKDFKMDKSSIKLKKRKLHMMDEYLKYLHVNKELKNRAEYCTSNIKNKKRSFIKPHNKYKSMSRISNEKSSVALDNIKTLDDFFVALGSAKTLTSIFDRNVKRKVLTSVKEMSSWISDITPRQAMLVLLLANKKDNVNLVRYRSVIVQGIAVNRITRASELDMEAEVIERENLNTFSEYEGIYYLPASVENHDALLEELQWIAKTTASDYQRPFDEYSERLLKSLLEKRKKLNPSYLRVMARYVGLGLLKPSK